MILAFLEAASVSGRDEANSLLDAFFGRLRVQAGSAPAIPSQSEAITAQVAAWTAKGYPPGLIRKATKLATEGTVSWAYYLSRFASNINNQRVEAHYLRIADAWIKRLGEP